MSKIVIEIDEKYGEYIDLIKEVIPEIDGSEIKDNARAMEILLESFVGFLKEQAEIAHEHEHNHDDGCGCGHDHH